MFYCSHSLAKFCVQEQNVENSIAAGLLTLIFSAKNELAVYDLDC